MSNLQNAKSFIVFLSWFKNQLDFNGSVSDFDSPSDSWGKKLPNQFNYTIYICLYLYRVYEVDQECCQFLWFYYMSYEIQLRVFYISHDLRFIVSNLMKPSLCKMVPFTFCRAFAAVSSFPTACVLTVRTCLWEVWLTSTALQ